MRLGVPAAKIVEGVGDDVRRRRACVIPAGQEATGSRRLASVPGNASRSRAYTCRSRFVSISIDPDQDTPAKLTEYAKELGAKGDWRFYTGSIEASETARRKTGSANHA